MRRKIGRILAPVMAAMLVFGGCGNKTTDRVTENQTHKTERMKVTNAGGKRTGRR